MEKVISKLNWKSNDEGDAEKNNEEKEDLNLDLEH